MTAGRSQSDYMSEARMSADFLGVRKGVRKLKRFKHFSCQTKQSWNQWVR
jgi:hypothetical protein